MHWQDYEHEKKLLSDTSVEFNTQVTQVVFWITLNIEYWMFYIKINILFLKAK